MKKAFLVTLTLALLTSLSAAAGVVATYDLGTPKEGNSGLLLGSSYYLNKVEVINNFGDQEKSGFGEIVVSRATANMMTNDRDFDEIGRLELSKETYLDLVAKIVQLADVEMKDNRFNIGPVCFYVPPPWEYTNTLSIVSAETSEIKAVLGPQGCFVSHSIRPEDDDTMRMAQSVKSQIIGLVADLLSE